MPQKQTAPTPAPAPKDQLKAAYARYINETNPARKKRAGKQLLRVVFCGNEGDGIQSRSGR